MRRLVSSLSAEKSSQPLPREMSEVILSKNTGWDYWTVVSQPVWFLERLALYNNAERAADKIRESRTRSKVPRARKATRR